jgi:hypothetical protein
VSQRGGQESSTAIADKTGKKGEKKRLQHCYWVATKARKSEDTKKLNRQQVASSSDRVACSLLFRVFALSNFRGGFLVLNDNSAQ